MARNTLSIIIRAKDLAKGTLHKVTAHLRTMGRTSEQTENQLTRLGHSIRNLVITSLGFYTIKRAMQGILQTGDQFERLQVQMNAVMGSIKEGQQAVEWIRQFTKETPLQLEQVAEAFVTLKNFGLDPMDGTLQAIVDQNSKLGGGFERLRRISLALGQAWGKQKLQGEELRQLIEAGVPVWDLLAKSTGKNVTELRKLSEQGKLGTDVIRGLIGEIGSSSAGAAADNMTLLSGLTSNMADRWTEFKNAVAEAGWLFYIKEQLAELSNRLDAMANNGRLQALAKTISDGFISMAESVKASLSSISFENFVANIQQSFASVSSILGSLRSAFTLTGNTVKLFLNGFTVSVKTFGLVISKALAGIAESSSRLFDTLGADELAQKAESISKSIKAIADGFTKEIRQDTEDINQALASMTDGLASQHQQVQEHIRTESQKTTAVIQQYQAEVQSAITETADTAKQSFTDISDALKQISAAETRSELADLGVTLAQAFAEGKLSQQQYNEALEASNQKLKALKQEAEATTVATQKLAEATKDTSDQQAAMGKRASSLTETLSSYYSGLTDELGEMSSAAVAAFESLQGVDSSSTKHAQDEIDRLKAELESARHEAQQLSAHLSFDPTGIDNWLKETGANAAYVKAQFLQQKIALEELLDGYERGRISAQQLAGEGRFAVETMDLLNQQDLDRLNRSIEQAEAGMTRLSDSAHNTLVNLQNELDQLQGKQEDIEQRQFETRKRNLKSQLKEARKSGDSNAINNLQQAVQLNQQIYTERRKHLQRQKQQVQQKKPYSTPPDREFSRINQDRPRRHTGSPEKVIRLEYPGGSVDIGVHGNDESKLLDALKMAGMRSV